MFDNEKSIEFPVKRTSEVVAALGSPRTVGKKCVYECIWLYNLVVPKKLKLTFLKFFWRFFSFHCQTYLNRTFSLRFFSSLCVNNVEKCWSFTYFNCDIRAAGIVTDEATFDGLYDEWMMWGQWEWNFKVYIGYCVISMR